MSPVATSSLLDRSGGMESFLATIRLLESGSYEGNYQYQGQRTSGRRPRGAYGILDSNWEAWAQRAGIAGADHRDPRAQDRVAAHRAAEYVDAYGSYDVAALAWIGGTESARKVMQRGYEGPQSIQNEEIRKYVTNYQEFSQNAPDFGVSQRVPAPVSKKAQGQGGWVMPVAGETEYSQGSWMPNTLTHRGRTHAATDIYASHGTPIVAPVSGKIISTKESNIGGFTARIQGDDGIIYYFAHMSEAAVVGAGQQVRAGAHIGFVGNSGSARNTSAHLHFSMKKANGEVINPYTYLEGSGNPQGVYPTGQAYNNVQGEMGASTQMNSMLDQLSNKIAGGQRNPDVLLGEDGPAETPTTGGPKTTTEVTA